MGQEKKKFKETAVGRFLSEKAPNVLRQVLDVADDYFPPAKILTALVEKGGVSGADLEEFEKLNQQYRIEMEKQSVAFESTVTDRWKADMTSDSRLSRNTRPLVMLSLMAFMYLIVTLDSIESPWCSGFQVKEDYIELLKMLLTTTVVAYFGSRGYEKTQAMKKR